jgi:flagellin-like hook-associated protein FlgL
MFSINTNLGAMAALQSLQNTQNSLTTAQNAVATGLMVGSASDNPAIYAISQSMNATIAGLTAVTDGLSFGAQVVSTATEAVANISSQLATLQNTITEGQSQGISSTDINTQITKQLTDIDSFASAATFNGVNLIAGGLNSSITSTQLRVLQDTSGNSFTIGGSGATVLNATSAGLGLSGLNVNTAGLTIDLTGLSASSIVNSGETSSSTGTSDTTVTLQTSNYNNSAEQSATNVGQQWVFEFSSAATTVDTTDTLATTTTTDSTGNVVNIEATDSNGNTTQQTTVVKVSLAANFTTSDAINALQSALTNYGFSAALNADGTLTVTGNNINASTGPNGTTAASATVSNLNYALSSTATAAGNSFTLNSVAGLVVGQQVQAQGASATASLASTYITAIDTNTNTITTSTSATGTTGLASGTAFSFGPVVNGTVSEASQSGANTIQLSSVAGLQLGQSVSDSTTGNTTAINANTVITAIDSSTNTITLSATNAAIVDQGDQLTFGTPQFLAADAASVGSTQLTLASTSGLSVGDYLNDINGTTQTSGTTTPRITKIDGNTVTLSSGTLTATTGNSYLTFGPATIATVASTEVPTAGTQYANTLALANVTGVKVGQIVTDGTTAGAVANGTYVTGVNATNNTITLSQSLSAATATGDAISFQDVPTQPSTALVNQVTGSTVVLQAITSAINKVNAISTTLGSASQEITGLQNYSSSLSDSLTAGVGALTDADMAAESAQLTSLQTKESLAIEALSIANSRPQSLLTLFR